MSVPSWCRIGAKCVLAKPMGDNPVDRTICPVVGAVYTIREFDDMPPADTFIRLEEIVNHPANDGYEPSFDPSYFRPVHTLRSDVRAIKSLLRDMPVTERLDRLLELINQDEGM